jgi:hypothetical protein
MDTVEAILWFGAFVASVLVVLKLGAHWQEVETLRRDAAAFHYAGWETSKLEELRRGQLELMAEKNAKPAHARSVAAINAALALRVRSAQEKAILKTLDDLSYIIECAAIDHMGDGKFELANLSDRLESDDPEYGIPDRHLLAAKLRECLSLYRSGDKYGSFSRLAQASRKLWADASKASQSCVLGGS